jgi:hypothetical protein
MRIPEYQELPSGERALYGAYALIKLEEEVKSGALKLALTQKGG